MRRIIKLFSRQQSHGTNMVNCFTNRSISFNSHNIFDIHTSSTATHSSSSSFALASVACGERVNKTPNASPIRSSLFSCSTKRILAQQPVRFIMTQQSESKLKMTPTQIKIENMFEITYKQILDEIIKDDQISRSPLLFYVKEWLIQSLDYNLKNGKRFRAKSLVIAFEQLSPGVDEEAMKKACLLGWCVELLQTYFLIIDDIMDRSITRRGQLCWYRKENVGMIAINDAVMINNGIYALLQNHFHSHPNYIQIVNLFNEITQFTSFGQCLDILSNPLPNDSLSKLTPLPNKEQDSNLLLQTSINLETFSGERQATIVEYKTSYYTFCLPVRLAMYLANIQSFQAHHEAETILLRIGHLFQVQDDFLDCYGDPAVTGKIGTDIEDGKCSWLAVRALERANNHQQKVLQQFYGLNDPESVSKIKELYQEIGLKEYFLKWEKEQFHEICDLIEDINEQETALSKKIFHQILVMIYKRKK